MYLLCCWRSVITIKLLQIHDFKEIRKHLMIYLNSREEIKMQIAFCLPIRRAPRAVCRRHRFYSCARSCLALASSHYSMLVAPCVARLFSSAAAGVLHNIDCTQHLSRRALNFTWNKIKWYAQNKRIPLETHKKASHTIMAALGRDRSESK